MVLCDDSSSGRGREVAGKVDEGFTDFEGLLANACKIRKGTSVAVGLPLGWVVAYSRAVFAEGGDGFLGVLSLRKVKKANCDGRVGDSVDADE